MNYVKLALSSVAGIAFAASASAHTAVSVPPRRARYRRSPQRSQRPFRACRAFRCANRLWWNATVYPVVNAGELEFGISIFLSTIWLAMARVCRREPNTKT